MPEQANFSYGKIEMGPIKDGASDTFLFAEVPMAEKEHVLTAVQQAPTSGRIGGIAVDPGDPNVGDPHTPEWTNPHGSDPGSGAPAGSVTFVIDNCGLHELAGPDLLL